MVHLLFERGVWLITFFSDMDEIRQLARLFLAIFVLIGVAPFLRKRIIGYIDYLMSLRRSSAQGSSEYVYSLEVAGQHNTRLEGVDYMVFVQLAQAGERGVSLRELKQQLHMESMLLTAVLQSLNKKGLIGVKQRWRFLQRYLLSRKGVGYAREQGVIL